MVWEADDSRQAWQATDLVCNRILPTKRNTAEVETKTVSQATPMLAIAPTQAACNICTYL